MTFDNDTTLILMMLCGGGLFALGLLLAAIEWSSGHHDVIERQVERRTGGRRGEDGEG